MLERGTKIKRLKRGKALPVRALAQFDLGGERITQFVPFPNKLLLSWFEIE